MNIQSIAGHSYDADRLSASSVILDAGCRDYEFCDGMRNKGHVVVTLDADAAIKPDLCFALVGEYKPAEAWYIDAAEAGRVVFEPNPTLKQVKTTTIKALSDMCGPFDLVKLDIEGSEYDVLLTWPGPVAAQISVEFHEHTGQGIARHGQDVYERIIKHLGKWYVVAQHEPTAYVGGMNYYDSLFVLR